MRKSILNNFVPARRRFLQGAALASVAAFAPSVKADEEKASSALPPAFNSLKPLGAKVRPIQPEEFQSRMQQAQQLIGQSKPAYDALFFSGGTSLYYFTGIHWGLSERLLCLLIPRTGNPFLVCPAFEEGRLRERLKFPIDIHVWQ